MCAHGLRFTHFIVLKKIVFALSEKQKLCSNPLCALEPAALVVDVLWDPFGLFVCIASWFDCKHVHINAACLVNKEPCMQSCSETVCLWSATNTRSSQGLHHSGKRQQKTSSVQLDLCEFCRKTRRQMYVQKWRRVSRKAGSLDQRYRTKRRRQHRCRYSVLMRRSRADNGLVSILSGFYP